jgi:hypothetical protein
VERPTLRDQDACPLDRVLVAKARSAHVDTARVHEQALVELRGLQVADVRLEDERLDAEVAKALVAAGVPFEVLDTRDLEPHEVVRVVRDPLRVGLGEAHPDRC